MPEQSARRYSSDLTDAQWQLIKPFFEGQTFREHHPREIVNAIFYHNKAGWQWRMLPQGEEAGFPPWQTVYLLPLAASCIPSTCYAYCCRASDG